MKLGFIAPSLLGGFLGDYLAFGGGQGGGASEATFEAALATKSDSGGVFVRVDRRRRLYVLDFARGDIDHALRPLI